MIEDFYDSTAVIQQMTTSKNSMGGTIKTYTNRIDSLPCRISAKGIAERDEFGKMTVREYWRLYCAASTTNLTIAESDKVIVNGRTFEVTGIGNPGMQNHHLEINMNEVR